MLLMTVCPGSKLNIALVGLWTILFLPTVNWLGTTGTAISCSLCGLPCLAVDFSQDAALVSHDQCRNCQHDQHCQDGEDDGCRRGEFREHRAEPVRRQAIAG